MHYHNLLLTTLVATATASPLLKIRDQARTKYPEVYPTLYRNGEFAAASIPKTCAQTPYGSTVLSYIDNVITDTRGTIFRADDTKQIILSFAGSSSVQNFVTDFAFIPVPYMGCPNAQAHIGFYNAYKSVQDFVHSGLSKAIAANPTYDVIIVGHSLGGALVSLAYADLKPQSQFKVTEAWSYGEPRVGNQQYSDCIDALSGASDSNVGTYHRVTHANDGVPLVPPQSAGFQHSRTEIWVNNDASGNTSADTTYRCYGQEAPDCVDGQGGVFINQAHIFYPGINYGTACGTGVAGAILTVPSPVNV